ncbi:MAG: hypothetical protein WD512_11775 [Candidatus Paceibacterota bacterium]
MFKRVVFLNKTPGHSVFNRAMSAFANHKKFGQGAPNYSCKNQQNVEQNIPKCCNCGNQMTKTTPSFGMRFLGAYHDIRRKRLAEDNDETKKQEWYKKAHHNDAGVSSLILGGSIIVGGAIGIKYNWDHWNSDNDQRLNLLIGMGCGFATGVGIVFLYPFPGVISLIGGTCVFFYTEPIIIRTIKNKM